MGNKPDPLDHGHFSSHDPIFSSAIKCFSLENNFRRQDTPKIATNGERWWEEEEEGEGYFSSVVSE